MLTSCMYYSGTLSLNADTFGTSKKRVLISGVNYYLYCIGTQVFTFHVTNGLFLKFLPTIVIVIMHMQGVVQ